MKTQNKVVEFVLKGDTCVRPVGVQATCEKMGDKAYTQ